jgi:hypothetical protein
VRAFSYELSAAGRPLYGAKGAHDDLVLSLALAIWGAERGSAGAAAFIEFLRNDTVRRQETHSPVLPK